MVSCFHGARLGFSANQINWIQSVYHILDVPCWIILIWFAFHMSNFSSTIRYHRNEITKVVSVNNASLCGLAQAWRNFRSATAKPLALDTNLNWPQLTALKLGGYIISVQTLQVSPSLRKSKKCICGICVRFDCLSTRIEALVDPVKADAIWTGSLQYVRYTDSILKHNGGVRDETWWDCFGLSYFCVNFHELLCEAAMAQMAQLSRVI